MGSVSTQRYTDFDFYSDVASPYSAGSKPGQNKVSTKQIIIGGGVIALSTFCYSFGNRIIQHFRKQGFINETDTSPQLQDPITNNDNVTSILLDLKKEQEELWRVVHNIYKGQADKIESLENSTAAILHILESQNFKKGGKPLTTASIAKISSKMDTFEQLQAQMQNSVLTSNQKITSELHSIIADLDDLKKSGIPVLLQKQNDLVLSKMQGFLESIKKRGTFISKDKP